MPERSERLSPEARTKRLFALDVEELADELVTLEEAAVIAVFGSNRKIRLLEVEAFKKLDLGDRYAAMNRMRPGDLWNPPMRHILQSLIVSQDHVGVGACVRLLKAEFFDPSTNSFVTDLILDGQEYKQREGAIAKYLGLDKFERSKLTFLDDSNTLYLIREGQKVNNISSEDANKEMERLLNE